jgi:protease-4
VHLKERFVKYPCRLALFIIAALQLGGCGGVRFSMDLIPTSNDLVQTSVFEDRAAGWSVAKVALIEVTGTIDNGEASGLLGLEQSESAVDRFAESLAMAARDTGIKAIIVNIDSPGGGVTASDLMYRELKHFRERTGKPAVVLMGSVAASGGYYLACAGDEIFANPTTVTGSIGVIMQTVNFSEGMKRIGIRADAITSGPNKSMGNPWEPMSPEHRAVLQGVVNDLYATFRGIVSENRPHIDAAHLDEITDGRVVTGPRAVELGVVDRLGDLRDAFASAKERAGIVKARLVKIHREAEHAGTATSPTPSQTQAMQTQINLLQLNVGGLPRAASPSFYYVWDPTVW